MYPYDQIPAKWKWYTRQTSLYFALLHLTDTAFLYVTPLVASIFFSFSCWMGINIALKAILEIKW